MSNPVWWEPAINIISSVFALIYCIYLLWLIVLSLSPQNPHLLFYCYYITPCEFFISALVDVLSLESDSKSLRSLLNILTYLNNAVIWMVSARLPIPTPPPILPSLWWSFRVHQLQLVSLSPSCFIVLWQVLGLFFLSFPVLNLITMLNLIWY